MAMKGVLNEVCMELIELCNGDCFGCNCNQIGRKNLCRLSRLFESICLSFHPSVLLTLRGTF